MSEPHGYRDALMWRIRVGNAVAYVAGGCTVVLGMLVVAGELAEFGVMAAGVCLATSLGAVRLVTWCRLELHRLGPPGPRLLS